jgi:putative tricarboxylic transport membrane protein
MTSCFAHGKRLLAQTAAISPRDFPAVSLVCGRAGPIPLRSAGGVTSNCARYSEVDVKTQRVADIYTGWLIALLGVLVLFSSTWISVAGVHRLSPRTFPYVVGFLLVACGIGLALKSRSLQNEGPAIAWPDGVGIRTITVTLVCVGCYIALMDPLGLPLATFLYLAIATWYLNRSRWLMALTIGAITGAASYYLFIRVLGLSFPAGFLFE